MHALLPGVACSVFRVMHVPGRISVMVVDVLEVILVVILNIYTAINPSMYVCVVAVILCYTNITFA